MSPLNRRRLLQLSGAACVAVATPAWSQDLSADWSPDVAILRQAWETMHPGLYRYSTPADMTARLDGLAQAWQRPSSFRDRFLALSRVTASVRCGHTYPSPYNSPHAVADALYPDRALVPFRFRWIDGRMVVTDDHGTGDVLPRGSVVTAIDGRDTRALLAELIPLARADGGNDAKRISLMEVRGDDRFETFDIHLPLILPVKDEAVFTLSDDRQVRAPLLTLAERQARLSPAASPSGDANPWTLTTQGDGVRILTMPGWALYNSDFAWEAWLGHTMDALIEDGARGLIVDLRGNEGGLDCGNVILSRLIERDLPLSQDQRWTRYRRAPEVLHPYLDTWDKSFLDWGEAAQASDDRPGFYRLTRYDDDAEGSVIRPQGRRFTGPVAVLCDASNSSATFQFARTAQASGAATLVGQPTGGNLRGINGGAFFFLRLPVSGLEVDLPLIATFPATPQPDTAVLPDVAVATTPEDVRLGRDPQLATALAVIAAR